MRDTSRIQQILSIHEYIQHKQKSSRSSSSAARSSSLCSSSSSASPQNGTAAGREQLGRDTVPWTAVAFAASISSSSLAQLPPASDPGSGRQGLAAGRTWICARLRCPSPQICATVAGSDSAERRAYADDRRAGGTACGRRKGRGSRASRTRKMTAAAAALWEGGGAFQGQADQRQIYGPTTYMWRCGRRFASIGARSRHSSSSLSVLRDDREHTRPQTAPTNAPPPPAAATRPESSASRARLPGA
ncbi:hypothetical protein B0H15DRAFT_954485 [Mycena belliarum]|uniref:Uncharacterized protein n=1 Tax=Mycena belliarum TaxID=1033014 RepID=A0AAD6XL16_9AGAR|nr:hypothetical protein B0H15DRAFT_954485 [Mycena belliae]